MTLSISQFVERNDEAWNEQTRMLCGLECADGSLDWRDEKGGGSRAVALAKQHLVEDFWFVGVTECFSESQVGGGGGGGVEESSLRLASLAPPDPRPPTHTHTLQGSAVGEATVGATRAWWGAAGSTQKAGHD